jgi:histidine ammonia-lyase
VIEIDGNHLTISEVVHVARDGEEAQLSPLARQQIQQAHNWVETILNHNKPVYGINTGFGVFADRRIPGDELVQLNRNLILSHASGSGPNLPAEVVRAAMLIRANTLSKGNSGVRLEVVQTLIDMLNRGVTPMVPEQGSLGSSGDLAPLSFMALVFTTDGCDLEEDSGNALFNHQAMSGKAAMQAAGLSRLVLGPKEGLAINNGATFTAALAALAVYDAGLLTGVGNIALAMSLEALLGCSPAFDDRIQQVRGYRGQMEVARDVRAYIRGSSLIDSTGRVQDAYSLRCAPQVQGAVLDTLEFVSGIVEREINAATDNPLLFGEEEAISGGNFHGEPVGLVMDYLGIALSELAAISERRVFRLTDGCFNAGLPPMLVDQPDAAGLNSGLMMPQYTAAALVLENRTLATPDSVNSLPTSAGQEDFNANSMTAGRHCRRIIDNSAYVLAIELFTAARALDLRLRQAPNSRPGVGVSLALQLIRGVVPYVAGDSWWKPQIDRVLTLVRSGELVNALVEALQDN